MYDALETPVDEAELRRMEAQYCSWGDTVHPVAEKRTPSVGLSGPNVWRVETLTPPVFTFTSILRTLPASRG